MGMYDCYTPGCTAHIVGEWPTLRIESVYIGDVELDRLVQAFAGNNLSSLKCFICGSTFEAGQQVHGPPASKATAFTVSVIFTRSDGNIQINRL